MTKRRMSAHERAKVFKALSDPRRVDMVDLLTKHGALCGTELADRLEISLALVCHHWEVLVDAGLVKKERVGQLRVCTLDTERLQEATEGWASGNTVATPEKRRAAPTRPKTARAKTTRAKR